MKNHETQNIDNLKLSKRMVAQLKRTSFVFGIHQLLVFFHKIE